MKKFFTLTILLLLILSFRPGQVKAQTDTEFWFAVPKLSEGHGWPGRKFYFRFANLNLANTITISMPADNTFAPIVVDLAPNEAATVEVTAQILELWATNPNQVYDRGIRIEATNYTTAYFEVGTHYNPDIFALKGRNALGEDFFIPFQNYSYNGPHYNPRPYSGIYIVATEDNTEVTITPTRPVFPGRPAGVPFTLQLNRGQTVAVVPEDYANTGQQADKHLGGTRVESDKPIAVTSSDDSVYGLPNGCYDLIGDQLIPTNIIGTEYIAMKGRLTIPEFFYVLATEPDTEVEIDGVVEDILQPGEQLRWEFTQQNHFIKTSKPAYVYHVAGFGCEQGGAVLPPINVCTGSTKVSFTRSKGESFFLNILVRAGAQDGFIFNGDGPNTVITASDFEIVPGTTNWLAAEYEMTQAQVGVGLASLIENTKDVFHLGIINGGPTSGTMYGYFSDFNELDIKANISGAGSGHRACFGDPVQLIAQGGVNYQWHPPDFLDDPTSATPIALPDSSIKYTVTVSGACKMTDSTSVFITLYGPAEAAFTIDEAEGCSPFDLNVINESYGISNYSWRMGDGTVYTTGAEEFDHTYINDTDEPQIRELMLVGRFSMCRDTMVTNVTVYPEVEADIGADIINGCAPLTVNFENNSKGAETYHWKFGDGASSSQKEPQHVFHNFTQQEITYYVEMMAISKSGCTSDTIIPVTVKPYIEAGFDFDPPVHCSPYDTEFSNTSFGATSNMWSFDGGANFEPIDQAQFTRLFENNGTTPEDFEIWLVTENDFGCISTYEKTLTVNPKITADFSTNVLEGCNPLLVEFENNSNAVATQFLWEFDHQQGTSSEQNPVILFENDDLNESAVFNVRLTATSDELCEDVIEKQITVYPRIEAGFTFEYTSYCTPQEVTFLNTSVGGEEYLWDFGDGETVESSGDDISHQFTNTTDSDIIYPVTLYIENASGCRDSIVRNITIYPQIAADFEMVTSGCHPLEVTFENNSIGASGYLWSFSDGGTSHQAAPSRIFTNDSHLESQTYTVTLQAESQFGCIHTMEKEITVHPKPMASYTMSDTYGCAPLLAHFTPNAIGASLYHWNFGDGTNETTSSGNVAHTYYNNNDAAANYTSRMIAENQFGCKDTLEKSVQIYPEITAAIQVSDINGCHPLEIAIENTSQGASADTPYFWNFGDGNHSTSEATTQMHTFENFSHTQTEEFTIHLRAESSYGCKDSTQTTITVFPRPSAGFTPLTTEGCSPLPVTFSDSSVGAMDYSWDYGDGNVSSQNGNAQHTFHQPHDMGIGAFPIELIIENQYGCTDSTYSQVNVFPEITAEFEAITEGCHPLEVSFSNLSLGVDTRNWTFGDGASSGHENPEYFYTNESHTDIETYTVSLFNSSVYGCEAQTSQTITVYPKPMSAFAVNLDEGCSPFLVEIENLSIGGDEFEWNLGNQTIYEDEPLFEHVFSNLQEDPVHYQLNLRTINEYGCWRESFQQVKVYPEVVAGFGADNDLMAGCNPLPLEFINQSERAHQYSWNFGDGNTSVLSHPDNTFYTPGTQETTYDVRLLATSVYGCQDSIMRQAKVYPVPVADFFLNPYAQTYPSKSIRANNLSAPGNWDFTWNMGDGTIIHSTDWETIEHEYTWPAGDYATKYYDVSLMASNEFCHDSLSQTVVVHAPFPVVGFEPATEGCPPFEVQFVNESEYGMEYFWDFDDGNFSQLENPAHTFYEPGTYNVKLLVSGEGGIDSTYQQITVFEMPKASFRVAPEEVQLPYESVRMINLSSMASYFEWHMGDGTVYYDFEPEHMYEQAGDYDIRLRVGTNTFPQCYDETTKEGAVIAEQECQIIFPDAFTPNTSGPGDGTYIVNDPANHVFYPIHTGVKDYQLVIYNRWGEFLFRSTDINVGWDGYYRGKLSSMDVYVWKVKATCHSGKEIEMAGDVTLYR